MVILVTIIKFEIESTILTINEKTNRYGLTDPNYSFAMNNGYNIHKQRSIQKLEWTNGQFKS